MPQPTLAVVGGFGVCKFGGLAQPNGQGTLTQINLNDGKQWLLQKLGESGGWDYDNRNLQLAPYVYRARSTYIGDDWKDYLAKLPLVYYEGTDQGGAGNPLGQQLALISQAGEQQLTFDNATALLVKFMRTQNRKQLNIGPPLLYSLEIDFAAKQGWYVDLSATTPSATALAGSAAGTNTNFNVAYPGSVYAEPSFTFTVPSGNGVVITQLVLTNTMPTPNEVLAINFPGGGLAASTAYTITINCATQQITDQNGIFYDLIGTFPQLYPNGPSGNNAFSALLTTASGSTTGVTIQPAFTNRWMF